MNNGDFTAGREKMTALPDKVDMSLDDIIRLNKKEKQFRRKQASGNRRPFKKKDRVGPGRGGAPRAAGTPQRGGGFTRGGAAKLRQRRIPPLLGRRRGQGVITGLAAKRPAVLLKRAGTLNRTAANQQRQRQKARPFNPRPELQYRRQEVQRRLYRQPDPHRGQNGTSARRPFQLRRQAAPPAQQTQREARQAMFLFRRGLKVQAQVQKPSASSPPVKTRQWSTQTAGSGILTVSIDNPSARTQPEPATAWTLHPPPVTPPVKVENVEKKVPKGVPLQFDINSVGKPQTSMTLNERFRILKDQRAATAQSSKGTRFVTVG
ncbi:UAP56-interacting factor isoform X2 [Austrofundulus limnaeus]|uniref:UAP56-interacting factor n=1 Tax=Austrofundulus limnaeus TaxID=52670 RepID=A0A2I4CFV8_AUSLI|nr:PREDICTED: UAP56-interacting factor isoform X2 [Austrofundulus limnaeus]